MRPADAPIRIGAVAITLAYMNAPRPAFELRQLRYFVRLADDGQMTTAAEALHIAQPALSQAIARLESQLHLKLFERHSRGVALTPAGAAFLEPARATLSAANGAAAVAETWVRAQGATIRIGFVASPPTVDAPELFDRFSRLHPDVGLSFRELSFPRASGADWLAGVDVGLIFWPSPHRDIQTQPLRREARVVVVATHHVLADRTELTLAEVLDHTFPQVDPTVDQRWGGLWTLNDHRGGPPAHVSTDRVRTLQEAAAVVVSGRAIMTSPASIAANVLKALPGVVAIPLIDAAPAVLTLVWRTGDANPGVRLLVALAREIAADTVTP
jgi:DNA-binding transcriptional LysR family regulator